MSTVNRVCFPLRSNVGWFQSTDLINDIENRIKLAILIYDEIFIEDGTYTADILESGSFSPYYPPGRVPIEHRTVIYERDIDNTKVKLAVGLNKQKASSILLQGNTIARFKIDYYNIINKHNLNQCDFIKFYILQDHDLPQKIRSTMSSTNFRDSTIFHNLKLNHFLKDLVIKNLNHDLVTSILLKSSVVLDARHGELLFKKMEYYNNCNLVSHAPLEIIVKHLLSITAPNFNELTFGQIVKLRNDGLWLEFRNFISDISKKIRESSEVLLNQIDIVEFVRNYIDKKLFTELKKRYKTGMNVMVDFGLGLTSIIPGYGLIPTGISLAKSGLDYLKDKSGWFAFLLKIEKMK